MKVPNEKIKESILFLKDKEVVLVIEIAEHLKITYILASSVITVLENNNLIDRFKGRTHRNVIADKSIFESELIFICVNDFNSTTT